MRPLGLLVGAVGLLLAGLQSDGVVLLWLSVVTGICAAGSLLYDVSRPSAVPPDPELYTPPPAPGLGAGGGVTS